MLRSISVLYPLDASSIPAFESECSAMSPDTATYPAGGGTKLLSTENHGGGPIPRNTDLYLKIAREAKNPNFRFPSKTLKLRAGEASPSGSQVAAHRNACRGPGGAGALKGAPAARVPLSLIRSPVLLSLSHNPQQPPGWGPQDGLSALLRNL